MTINDPTIFEPKSFETLWKNWRNGNYLGGIPECKNWRTLYPISFRKIPVVFQLNEKYKRLIEEYIQYGLESKYPFEYALQVVFENAIIEYISYPAWFMYNNLVTFSANITINYVGSIPSGGYKYVGSTLAPNGKIYCIPITDCP